MVETNRGGQVDLPRARPARLLSDPRPQPPRQGRRGYVRDLERGDHPHHRRRSGSKRPRIRGADRRLDAAGARSRAAEDRVDRRPCLPLGDDARLCPQRRPRPCAVHAVDHRLRARGRAVHVDGRRARSAGDGRGGPAGGSASDRRGLRLASRSSRATMPGQRAQPLARGAGSHRHRDAHGDVAARRRAAAPAAVDEGPRAERGRQVLGRPASCSTARAS